MMTDLITANPNLVGAFASNLILGQGVGQAIAENKLGEKIKVIAFDSDDKTVGFLKDGSLAGLVVQDPYRMGYDGVKTALAVSKGEKVEANVDTGANLVTKANMSDPKIDALLNPKIK
jgi:ribose transport system substrate-binding protein